LQTSNEWIECQIGYWRGYLYGEFTAVYRGEAPGSIAGHSDRFRWRGRGVEPPRTPATEARLAELCRTLENAGWERYDSGEPGSWYELSFRRFVGTPGRGALALSIVPAEQTAEPAGAAAADDRHRVDAEPETAQVESEPDLVEPVAALEPEVADTPPEVAETEQAEHVESELVDPEPETVPTVPAVVEQGEQDEPWWYDKSKHIRRSPRRRPR
jgi:hypothetical protein